VADSTQAVTLTAEGGTATHRPGETPAQLAARFGLTVSGARPSLFGYTRQLWQRRHFIVAFANAKTRATYSDSRLGQVWQVLTPLLNAVIYYLVFGVLMGQQKGSENYTAFLVTGIFIFTFTQSAVLAGSRAINGQLNLIRALHFPRASLPISFTIVQLQQLLVSMIVLIGIVLGTGETPRLTWLLLLPVLILQFVFNVGLSLAVARLGATMTDISQLLPFILRAWLYLSGVFYAIDRVKDKVPEWAQYALEYNPAAVFIEICRKALIEGHTSTPPHVWIAACAWSVLVGLGGYVYFWKAEERYGRG
jgi:teichoic acid transport system permease protein